MHRINLIEEDLLYLYMNLFPESVSLEFKNEHDKKNNLKVFLLEDWEPIYLFTKESIVGEWAIKEASEDSKAYYAFVDKDHYKKRLNSYFKDLLSFQKYNEVTVKIDFNALEGGKERFEKNLIKIIKIFTMVFEELSKTFLVSIDSAKLTYNSTKVTHIYWNLVMQEREEWF